MGPILFVLFIVVPLLELAVIIQVGQIVGVAPTIVALLGISLAGAALVKAQGRQAWRRFRQALAEGRAPANEVVDGALLLVGATLLLTPGFLTDAVGLLLLIPVTRAGLRRLVRRRVRVLDAFGAPRPGARRGGRPAGGPGARRAPDQVVDVEVVDIERNTSPRSGGATEPPGTDADGR